MEFYIKTSLLAGMNECMQLINLCKMGKDPQQLLFKSGYYFIEQ